MRIATPPSRAVASKPTEVMKLKNGTDGSILDGGRCFRHTQTADREPGKTRVEKVLSKVAVIESKRKTIC